MLLSVLYQISSLVIRIAKSAQYRICFVKQKVLSVGYASHIYTSHLFAYFFIDYLKEQ